MKNILKNVLVLLTVISIAIGTFTSLSVTAMADTGTVTLGSESSAVTVGEKFKVTLTIKSDVPVSGLETYITYPAKLAKFISADQGITGGNGILKVNLLDADEGETWNSFDIRFKARNTGEFKVKFADAVHLYSYASGEELSISTSPVTINIKADTGASDDATLQALRIGGEALTPAFDKDTRNYYVSVENDVKSLVISAIPNDSSSTVTVSGNKGFKVGSNNIIKITVTAESGNTSEYTIQVTRKSKSGDTKDGTDSEAGGNASGSGLTGENGTAASGSGITSDPLMEELNPGLASGSAVESASGEAVTEGENGSYTTGSEAITSGGEAITNGNTGENTVNNPFPSIKIDESGAKIIRSVIIVLAVVVVLLVIFSIIYLFTKKKE